MKGDPTTRRIRSRLGNAKAWSHAVLSHGDGFDPICDAHEIVAEADEYRQAILDVMKVCEWVVADHPSERSGFLAVRVEAAIARALKVNGRSA